MRKASSSFFVAPTTLYLNPVNVSAITRDGIRQFVRHAVFATEPLSDGYLPLTGHSVALAASKNCDFVGDSAMVVMRQAYTANYCLFQNGLQAIVLIGTEHRCR